jgi:hypothetical protein
MLAMLGCNLLFFGLSRQVMSEASAGLTLAVNSAAIAGFTALWLESFSRT